MYQRKETSRLAKQLIVSTLRGGKTIELRNIQRGKYFRIVADVYVDGFSLADVLIQNKLVVRYDGGTKVKDWCE